MHTTPRNEPKGAFNLLSRQREISRGKSVTIDAHQGGKGGFRLHTKIHIDVQSWKASSALDIRVDLNANFPHFFKTKSNRTPTCGKFKLLNIKCTCKNYFSI